MHKSKHANVKSLIIKVLLMIVVLAFCGFSGTYTKCFQDINYQVEVDSSYKYGSDSSQDGQLTVYVPVGEATSAPIVIATDYSGSYADNGKITLTQQSQGGKNVDIKVNLNKVSNSALGGIGARGTIETSAINTASTVSKVFQVNVSSDAGSTTIARLTIIVVACDHEFDGCTDAVCNICNYERPDYGHVYTSDCDTTCNNEGCEFVRTAPADHKFDSCEDTDCNACEYTREAQEHVFDYECSETCSVCGSVNPDVKDHDYDNDCDTDCNYGCGTTREPAHTFDYECSENCSVCGAANPDVKDHDYDNDCDTDCNYGCGTTREPVHTFDYECSEVCSVCGEANPDAVAHTYTNCEDTACVVCGEGEREALEHEYTNSCDADCNNCGAERDITHTYDYECSENCSVCGEANSDV
ncbi:MAG: hypothetical protein MJ172_11925, partial [Clostridia bacterium]|nr:hypothetical protein [Clostridia bacterium]